MEEFLKIIGAKHCRIRDPLYGFIPMTKAETDIVNSPIFQRLRRIRQLALTNYVYPTAEHSRFVHSLGVMHCATLILSGIFTNKYTKINWIPNEHIIKCLRFAALLHDIGHLPFSHAVEKQWLKGSNHEEVGMYIINNYEPITKAIQSEDIKPTEVANLLDKKPTGNNALLHAIISGPLDADRADYLRRDSYMCGVRYGEYDFARFLSMFAVQEEEGSANFKLYVDEDDLPMAESMLIARYHYNLQIPYHRTRSGFDCALRKFIEAVHDYDKIFTIENKHIKKINIDKLIYLDDESIISQAKKSDETRKIPNPWAPYVLRKKHLKIVIDTNNLNKKEEKEFKHAALSLRQDNKFIENENYFIQSQEVEMLKGGSKSDDEGEIKRSASQQGDIIRLLPRFPSNGQKVIDIRDRSWIFGRLLETPHRICRIFATPELEEAVSNFCRKLRSRRQKK